MGTTIVTVFRNGKPSSGEQVSLEFVGSLVSGGFTEKFYTDSSGRAQVQHKSEGQVKVYVGGNHSSHGTTGRAPGSITVYL